MNKGVNFKISASNTAGPAFASFNRGMNAVRDNAARTQPVLRSWNAGLNQNRRAVQQFGFQMSDFAIQIAGGQSAMLAFTQQGGQMLQFFGPAGAILAALVAVFGSLYIGITRAGLAVDSFYPYLGVLEGDLRGVIAAVQSTIGVFADMGRFVVDNLDTIIIAIGIAAGYMATRWVAGVIVARTTTGAFSNTLRALAVSYATVGPAATAAMVATTAFRAVLSTLLVPGLIIGLAVLVQRILDFRRVASDVANTTEGTVAKTVELDDAFKTVRDTATGLNASIKILDQTTEELAATYGDATVEIQQFAKFQAELRIAEATDNLRSQIGVMKELTEQYYSFNGQTNRGGTNQRDQAVQRIVDDFGIATEAAREFEEMLRGVAATTSFDDQVAMLGQMQAFFEANGIAASQIPPELRDALIEMITLNAETARAEKLANDLVATLADGAPAVGQTVVAMTDVERLLGEQISKTYDVNEVIRLMAQGYSAVEIQMLQAARVDLASPIEPAIQRAVSLAVELGVTYEQGQRAAATLDRIGRFNAGSTISQINAISNALNVSTRQAIALARALPGYSDGGVAGPDGAVVQARAMNPIIDAPDLFTPPPPAPAVDGGGTGGGTGGAVAELQRQADQAAEAYDRLMGRMDPAIAAAQQFAENQEVINTALETGHINADQAATALAMLTEQMRAEQFADFHKAVEQVSDQFTEVTLSAGSLRDVLEGTVDIVGNVFRDMAQEIISSQVNDAILQVVENLKLLDATSGGGNIFGNIASVLVGAFTGSSSSGQSGRSVQKVGPLSASPGVVVPKSARASAAPNPAMNVVINENAVEGPSQTKYDPDSRTLTVDMGRAMADHAQGGGLDRAMNNRYGIRPKVMGG